MLAEATTMRTLSIFLGFVLICAAAQAQPFAGTYASGETRLTLEEDEFGDYVGIFIDEQGRRYEVELEKEGQELGGFFWDEETEFSVGAALDGAFLVLYLIPFDAEDEPDEAAAKEYTLERQDGPPQNQISPPANRPTSPDAMMPPQQPSAFAGSYTGALNGVATTLAIQQQGATLQGRADAGGYRYTLSGTVSGPTARGRLDDPNTGGGLDIELSLQGDQLTLMLFVPDAFGQVQRTPTYFQRGGVAPPGPTPGAAEDANVERDPRLVGQWSHQEVMSGGGVSVATQLLLRINPDGTYASGDVRTLGGGANWSGDTGRSGDVSRGTWRTQGGIVYVKDRGVGPWTPYARYTVQGGSLMFTFGDGSTQLWRRQ